MRKRKNRGAFTEKDILSERLGMSLTDFQKLFASPSERTPQRLGVPLNDFQRMILQSNVDKASAQNGGGKHYSYFSNTRCEYFPCHPAADRENFNCLFCYCPLYMLGTECGGTFRYLPNGCKDCTDCLYPHLAENYDAVTMRYADILARMAETE